MAQRIYALAKELKLDSKDLVDICAKAGVTGKGSALASLTDEEVVKLRAYLASPRGPAAASAPIPPQSPSAPAPPPILSPTPPAPPASLNRPATTGPMRREDYIAPGGISGRPPVLPPTKPNMPARSDKPPIDVKRRGGSGGESARPPLRVPPAVKFAPLPGGGSPPPPPPSEPAPQKPDIKLPIDAIRAGRAGGAKPLQEHMRKHEQRRKAEADTQRGPAGPARGPAPPVTPGELPPLGGRDRPRRGTARPGAAAVGPGGEGAAPAGELGGREARQLKRRRPGSRRRDSEDESGRSAPLRMRRLGTNTAAPRKSNVVVELPCTVRSFSEAIGVPVQRVLAKLLTMGSASNINASLDAELAEFLAVELGVEVDFKQPVDLENELIGALDQPDDEAGQVEPRPPVVTFLGHVDHGKTSLLDRLIGIDVVSQESGGITQHIRAYRIEKDGRPITFVDTPGHEAFTEMRARGANVTDIAVLVVAADDGVMPQTEEAISHARAAEVPIVVALNKIDLPGVNLDRIYQQLSTNGLQPTQWGGETEVVHTSALKGTGLDDLLETLLTMAELHEYKAQVDRAATGTCLEAELHEGRGVVAKMLVQKGTLHVGDVVVCGGAYGRVKAMYDTLDARKTYDQVGPSTPVNLTGLNLAPGAGDHFYVLDDIAQAREIAETRQAQSRAASLSGARKHVTLEGLFEQLGKDDEVKTLNLILRADVRGSIEAIQKELTKLSHPEVQLRVLQATVGGITEADVHLADASDAIIIGFNVVPDEKARVLAEQRGVQVRRYDIIYQVTADLKLALEGLLKPEQREVEVGRALVLRLFTISRIGTVAGCRVLSGTIERNARIRVIRENRIIGDYGLDSLRREKDDAREVREGLECGMKLVGFNDLKEGDVLEAYKVEEIARTI